MARLNIKVSEIKKNIQTLTDYFNKHNVQWSLVTKVFSGDQDFLRELLTPDVIKNLHSVGDSRLTSLKNLKSVHPQMRTIYIKPPARVYADDIVKYADISLNSSYNTIAALNDAAKKQNKVHEIILMVEMGELREGIERDNLVNFYKRVFEMSNIEVIGLGSNLGCMYGVEPTYDKLLQLSLYKKLIELKFDKKINLISGGSSITLPLLEQGSVPPEINHFRIGEAVFFGTSPYDNEQFLELSTDTFNFYANIIELEEKGIVPDGVISEANIGHTAGFKEEDLYRTTYKGIVDFGMLDVDYHDLTPVDPSIKFVGTTSDMTVYDLGDNVDDKGEKKYAINTPLCFKPSYMAAARLLNSKFIDLSFND
ncbi:MAG: alanine racemase [Salinivirgaceae bacterium]